MGFFDNPFKEIGNAWDSARESFERSDVGRFVSTAARPLTSGFEGAIDIGKGLATGNIQNGFETAGKRALGTIGQLTNPLATLSNASATVEGILRRDNFLNDWAVAGDAFSTLQSGNDITKEQQDSIVNMFGKEAAIAGAVYAAPAVASAATAAGTWAAANPATAAIIGSQLYNATRTGNYSGVVRGIGNEFAPGLGDGLAPIVSPPIQNRPNPVSQPTQQPNAYSNYTVPATDTKTIIALVVAGFVLILLIFKKMR